jgi:hypothetical protein
MLRRLPALLALMVAPWAVFNAVGCSDEPAPEDLCGWLADDNSCFARFADDIGAQCGATYVPGNDPVAAASGFFSTRDDLSICVKNAGGQVIFDPPLALTTFPVDSVTVNLLGVAAAPGGSISVSSSQAFSVSINGVSAADAGVSGPLDDDITGGSFSSSLEPDRTAFNVSCPGGQETHRFNNLSINGCQENAGFVPQAIVDSSPGVPETPASQSKAGFVRLRMIYPPEVTGGEPRVIEYFNCLIPAPPPPCQDGAKNGDETDIDCGGSCSTKCAEGQFCNDNDDCSSNSCGLNGGLRQCLPAA